MLETILSITWQKSPPLPSRNQPLSCFTATKALRLSCGRGLLRIPESHLLKAISSLSEHRSGEVVQGCAAQLSTSGLGFLPQEEGCSWRGNCAAADNGEGCGGFCRASLPFRSHSTMKRRDLVFLQCPEWLPEELSEEAEQKREKTEVIP